jgi:hypothetical protein
MPTYYLSRSLMSSLLHRVFAYSGLAIIIISSSAGSLCMSMTTAQAVPVASSSVARDSLP